MVDGSVVLAIFVWTRHTSLDFVIRRLA